MPFEQGLYQLLTDPSSAVGALVGTSVWFSQLPKGASFPALVIHTVANPPIVDLDSTASLQQRRIQVDCISSIDQLDARSLARAVMAALRDFSGTLDDGTVVSTAILNNDIDLPYEVGAHGYAFRVALDFTLMFVEAS
jgi:hypothetical protein